MLVPFTKMQGLGNDFVVFNAVAHPLALTRQQLRRIADRRFGVGCDQVLLVEPPKSAGADFYYRIFNADGGEVEQCGNGARCLARFVREKGLSARDEIAVETVAGMIYPRVEADGQITVNMGVPIFEPERVPFQAHGRELVYDLEVGGDTIQISVLSLGNPHAVHVVEDIEAAPVSTQGPMIESHPRFPRRVNAGYMQVIGPGHIRVRVYERGVGETLACGTGACAAVVAGRQRGLLDATVTVQLKGGTLSIAWQGEGQPVLMTGPAETVFEGTIDLDRL